MNAEADGRYIFMRYSHFLLFCIQLNSFHFPFSANFNPVLGVRLKYINEPLRQGSQADHQSGQDHTQPGLDLHQNGQQGRCNSQASGKKERNKKSTKKHKAPKLTRRKILRLKMSQQCMMLSTQWKKQQSLKKTLKTRQHKLKKKPSQAKKKTKPRRK